MSGNIGGPQGPKVPPRFNNPSGSSKPKVPSKPKLQSQGFHGYNLSVGAQRGDVPALPNPPLRERSSSKLAEGAAGLHPELVRGYKISLGALEHEYNLAGGVDNLGKGKAHALVGRLVQFLKKQFSAIKKLLGGKEKSLESQAEKLISKNIKICAKLGAAQQNHLIQPDKRDSKVSDALREMRDLLEEHTKFCTKIGLQREVEEVIRDIDEFTSAPITPHKEQPSAATGPEHEHNPPRSLAKNDPQVRNPHQKAMLHDLETRFKNLRNDQSQ